VREQEVCEVGHHLGRFLRVGLIHSRPEIGRRPFLDSFEIPGHPGIDHRLERLCRL